MKVDVIHYSGQITTSGYTRLCKELARHRASLSESALLVMGTPGGSPDAGFRIARALQHSYPKGFDALVPRYCKSAGTLVLLGARALYMADESELGPLDIQVKKGDELYGRSSGLDITQAVEFLKGQALVSFTEYMQKLVGQGLSTKVAADISVRLVQGILNPIAAQIEPLRVAEMQRATTITFSYGDRLAQTGKNVKPTGVAQLVTSYPSHGFVIDRKEARDIFISVDSPTDFLRSLCEDFEGKVGRKVNDSPPHVSLESKEFPSAEQGASNDTSGSAPQSLEGSPGASDKNVPANGRAGAGSKKPSRKRVAAKSR
jgi:hypothetical protein